jgi:UDP-GlcNAc:undecaprenyl-phosphate GlcNAc-1-phosphate transferase
MLRWAPGLGLIDHPNDRKFHAQTTPKGGGLAIYVGFAASIILLGPERLFETRMLPLLGVGLAIVALGALDDLHQLSWQLRLVVQTAAAWLALGWPAQSDWLAAIVSIVWVVGLINAFNMLDNMDALSAGVAAIAALCLALVRTIEPILGSVSSALPEIALFGAVLGFLWFNRPPARIFMGDAGSTFLGFFFGIRSLNDGLAQPAQPATWIVPLCILAVAWYDMTTVIALRLCQGRSPFHADKQHFSHRLVDLGLRSTSAVAVIHLLALASGVAGIVLTMISAEHTMAVAALVALAWSVVAIADYLARRRRLARAKAPVEALESC